MRGLQLGNFVLMALLAMASSSSAEDAAADSTSSPPAAVQADPSTELRTSRHLFILSGQSNMTRLDPDVSFAPAVAGAFGKDNVTVVKSAKSGAAIRWWDKDYKWPEGRPEIKGRQRQGKENEAPKVFGYLYDPLMEAVKKGTAGTPRYDTVTLIWMQGESDAGEDLAELYIDSFQRVLARLKSDLNIESMNVVIGRLSDWGLDNPKLKVATEKMREIQVKFAEANPNVAWVDTDDLNDGVDKDGKPANELHYPAEGSKTLGQRFAEKAIELLKKK